MTIIDNDFHPIDQGLNATEDHWGSERKLDDGAKLIDMVDRGRSAKSSFGFSVTRTNKPEMRN